MVAVLRRLFNVPNAASGRRRGRLSVRSTILILLATVTAVVVLGWVQQHPPDRRTKRMSVEWRTTGEARTVTGVLLDASGEPLNDRVVSVRGVSRWTRADGPTRSGQFHVDLDGLAVTGVHVTPGDTVEWSRYWCPTTSNGLHLTIRLDTRPAAEASI